MSHNFNPLRIVCPFSGGASAMQYLIENDAHYGTQYSFVGAFTNNKQASGIDYCFNQKIPYRILDSEKFANQRGKPSWSLLTTEAKNEYFKDVVSALYLFRADLLLCAGFMLIIQKPLLEAYPDRIINVHPADLTIMGNRKRKYRGAHAVQNALALGETQTRSTIHVVNEEVDGGPIICLSQPLEVTDPNDWQDHQNKMKDACDGPAYVQALQMIISGEWKLPKIVERI